MKSKALGLIAGLIALALATSSPALAQPQTQDQTPKIKDSGAIAGDANKVDFDLVFDYVHARVIQIDTRQGGRGLDDAAYNDIMLLYSSAVRGAIKDAQAAKQLTTPLQVKPKPKPLTKEELAKIDVDLPFVFGSKKDVAGHEHIILWDSTGKGSMAAFHEPRWEQQAKVLKKKLKALGADDKRIHIRAIKKKEDFLAAIKAHKGKKKIYIFGHGDPLVIVFGGESIKLADNAKALQEEKVDMVCHYGCSFVNVGMADLKALQDKMEKGTHITLYGHRKASNKTDDTPWDKDNPIVRCEVGKDCAKLYEPNKEAQAWMARRVKTQLDQFSQWGFPGAGKSLDKIAAYDGTEPKKIITPSPWDKYIYQAIQAAKGFKIKPVPPMKMKPAVKRLKKAQPPKSWYQRAWDYVWGEDS